jgi:hypothetical protein
MATYYLYMFARIPCATKITRSIRIPKLSNKRDQHQSSFYNDCLDRMFLNALGTNKWQGIGGALTANSPLKSKRQNSPSKFSLNSNETIGGNFFLILRK